MKKLMSFLFLSCLVAVTTNLVASNQLNEGKSMCDDVVLELQGMTEPLTLIIQCGRTSSGAWDCYVWSDSNIDDCVMIFIEGHDPIYLGGC